MRTVLRTVLARLSEPARVRVRATFRSRQLDPVFATGHPSSSDIVLITVVRDDAPRLTYFMDYYRRLGVGHFIVIDNGSTDETLEVLRGRDAVTVYSTDASFRASHYGVDWVNGLLRRLHIRNWVVWVDSDEFLVFDGSERSDLRMLTRHLDHLGARSLQCLLLDLYSRNETRENVVASGEDPFTVCRFYDAVGYRRRTEPDSRTTWVKGGVRGRLFFADDIDSSPALNKTPLVRWGRSTWFVQVAHRLLPARLNDSSQAVGLTGVLLHHKFLSSVAEKAGDEAHVVQHDPEYKRYGGFGETRPWDENISHELLGNDQLVADGLMTRIDRARRSAS